MKKFMTTMFAFLAMNSFSVAEQADKQPSKQVRQIVMKSISYDPKTMTIKAGESVQWINQSMTEHSASADDGITFETGLVQPSKKSNAIEMTKPGTFSYHCSVHGKTMHANIIVQ